MVLTQECDLEQDHANRESSKGEQDKFLPSILFAPAYLAQKLREGEHLIEFDQKMQRMNSKMWNPQIKIGKHSDSCR